jgi:hypothetical protein
MDDDVAAYVYNDVATYIDDDMAVDVSLRNFSQTEFQPIQIHYSPAHIHSWHNPYTFQPNKCPTDSK